jgi:hypothetical protein
VANTGLAVAVAVVAVAASFAIGHWAAPALLSRAARAGSGLGVHAPAEIATVDEAARVSLALETYRRIRGEYPPDLETLGREGFLPPSLAMEAASLYAYRSDGATYTRVVK